MTTTNDDIYRAVGRIEGMIETFISQMKVQDERATAMETRLRAVENKQYWLSGAGSILGTIFGALGIHLKW